MYIKSDFDTIEIGIERLKDAVSLKEQMCGNLYYNILEDNCCTIANKLLAMGANRDEISKIMGR